MDLMSSRSNSFTYRPQVSYLAMQDSVEGDPCKFVLWSRGSAERFTLQASSAGVKMTWVDTIAILLDAQNNFLSGPGITNITKPAEPKGLKVTGIH